MRQGRQQGIGGALLTLGKNLASGKKLGSGALKGVLRAGVTPGSGISAGAGLAGELLKKSKRPGLQKLGKGLGAAGNIAGMLTGGGGGGGLLKGAGKLLKGVVGGGKGAGLLKGAMGALSGGGGGGGGGGLGALAKGALGALTGADGMRVPMENGGKVSNGDGAEQADLDRLKELQHSYDKAEQGIVDEGFRPFATSKYDRERDIIKYQQYLREEIDNLRRDLKDRKKAAETMSKARAEQEMLESKGIGPGIDTSKIPVREDRLSTFAQGGVVNYQAGGAVPVDPGAGGSAPVQPAPQGGGAPAPDPNAAVDTGFGPSAAAPTGGATPPEGGAAPQQGGGGLFGGKFKGKGLGKTLLKGALLGPAGLLLGKGKGGGGGGLFGGKGGGGLFGRNQEEGGLVSYNVGGAIPPDPAAGVAPDPAAGAVPDPTAGGATPQQGGGGGGKGLFGGGGLGKKVLKGALLGPLALLGKKGEEGMRVSMENGGRTGSQKELEAKKQLKKDLDWNDFESGDKLTEFQLDFITQGWSDEEKQMFSDLHNQGMINHQDMKHSLRRMQPLSAESFKKQFFKDPSGDMNAGNLKRTLKEGFIFKKDEIGDESVRKAGKTHQGGQKVKSNIPQIGYNEDWEPEQYEDDVVIDPLEGKGPKLIKQDLAERSIVGKKRDIPKFEREEVEEEEGVADSGLGYYDARGEVSTRSDRTGTGHDLPTQADMGLYGEDELPMAMGGRIPMKMLPMNSRERLMEALAGDRKRLRMLRKR